MSAASQPKTSRTFFTSALAPSSSPQTNIVGFVPPKSGFTMRPAPTQEKHFTRCAFGCAFWSCSISD